MTILVGIQATESRVLIFLIGPIYQSSLRRAMGLALELQAFMKLITIADHGPFRLLQIPS